MEININNKKIIKAVYGKNNTINVTNIILANVNKNICINNKLFNIDPEKYVVKELTIFYDDNTKDVIKENTNIFLKNDNKKENTTQKNIDFGFIIIRYVVDEKTNNFWIECYKSIRKFYNNKIVIIDDNSNKNFLTDIKLENTIIVNSEFPKRGEYLPYYYYYHNKYFDRAVVFHDGIIVKNYFNYGNIKGYNSYTKLFHFNNHCYKLDLNYFKSYCENIKEGNDILKYHNTNIHNLYGCFGIMYIIDHDFLVKIQEKYNILNLVNIIDTRLKRQSLERFFATLFRKYCIDENIYTLESLFGDFHFLIKNENNYLYKRLYGR